jgi:integrase/recombinase XerD
MGKKDKAGSLKLPVKVLKILEEYKGKNHEHNVIFSNLAKLLDFIDLFSVQERTEGNRKTLGITKKQPCTLNDICSEIFLVIKFPFKCCRNFTVINPLQSQLAIRLILFHKDADEALDMVIGF